MSQSVAVLGSNVVPLTYTVPVPGTLTALAASATFNGSAAASFVPALSFYDNDGNLIARAVASAVAAGASAEVSWFPRVAQATADPYGRTGPVLAARKIIVESFPVNTAHGSGNLNVASSSEGDYHLSLYPYTVAAGTKITGVAVALTGAASGAAATNFQLGIASTAFKVVAATAAIQSSVIGAAPGFLLFPFGSALTVGAETILYSVWASKGMWGAAQPTFALAQGVSQSAGSINAGIVARRRSAGGTLTGTIAVGTDLSGLATITEATTYYSALY